MWHGNNLSSDAKQFTCCLPLPSQFSLPHFLFLLLKHNTIALPHSDGLLAWLCSMRSLQTKPRLFEGVAKARMTLSIDRLGKGCW